MIPEKSHRLATQQPIECVRSFGTISQDISQTLSDEVLFDGKRTLVRRHVNIDNAKNLCKYSVKDFCIENLTASGVINQLNIVHLNTQKDITDTFDFQSLANQIISAFPNSNVEPLNTENNE